MTKAIWVLIILVIGYIGYLMFQQWDKARLEHAGRKNEPTTIVGDSLPGMPYQLDQSYKTAKGTSAAAFQTWFTTNERHLADPRKAWIELELCVAMSRQNPAEARKIFANVKARVPPSSPVWSRLKELEKTFE